MTSKKVIFVVEMCCLQVLLVYGAEVIVPPSDTGVRGEAKRLNCTYTVNAGETVFGSITWTRQSSDGSVVNIAQGLVQGETIQMIFQQEFRNRCQYVGADNKDASVMLTNIATSDEATYTCTVPFSISGTLDTKFGSFLLEVDILPSVNIDSVPVEVIGGAVQTDIVCRANLGKPEASLTWYMQQGNGQFERIGAGNDTQYTGNDDQTRNAVSTLSLELDSDNDINYKFRCEVSNRQATLNADSSNILVRTPSPVTEDNTVVEATCKYSSVDSNRCSAPRIDFYVGEEIEILCTASNAYPAASYEWSRIVGTEINVLTETSATLSMQVTSDYDITVIYRCNATNDVRRKPHEVAKDITLTFQAAPTHPPGEVTTNPASTTTQTGGVTDKKTEEQVALGGGEIAGIVIGGVAVVVILIVIILYFTVFKKKSKATKYNADSEHGVQNKGMNRSDDGHNAQPDVVGSDQLFSQVNKPRAGQMDDPRNRNVEGLVYADLALDDTPRSRKPIQAYELAGTEYAEIRK